jgi:WD40 repeat protein
MNLSTAHPYNYTFTSLTIDPVGNFIATGDSLGKISLWYCLSQQYFVASSGFEKSSDSIHFSKSLSSSIANTFHWHSHGVLSLQVSPDGNYLLSGGEEVCL